MDQTENVAAPRSWWQPRKFPERFDQAVVLILNGIIMIVIVMALVSLTVKVVASLMVPGSLDPTDHVVFQTIFGMIFTVIIALEFRRSLLVVAEVPDSHVQVRAVVLIAILAILRKLLILDFTTTSAGQLLGLAATILALGAVYAVVREQDRRESDSHRRMAEIASGKNS
jgi:uncharacterized membrane protein (DUF373 family)